MYVSEDKSFTISSNLSSINTNAELMLDICRKAHNIINSYITTEMGYTRIDERGDRSDVTLTGTNRYDFLYVVFNNVYKLNDDNNFLICAVEVIRTGSDNSWSEFNFNEYVHIGFKVHLTYSNTIVNSDNFSTVNDAAYEKTVISNMYPIDNIEIASPIFDLVKNGNIVSITFPMRIVTVTTKENDSDKTIAKFLINGNNLENTVPHIGYMQINGENNLFISVLSNYNSGDTYYYSSDIKVIDPTASISNFFVLKNEDYKRALSNFLSSYSFKNTQQKLPLIPVYIASSDSISTTTYDFNRKITGLYQTSIDYANSLGIRYALNNKYYISWGNHFLMEEGEIS